MKKLFAALLSSSLLVLAAPAFANDEDLQLPGEKWIAKFDKFVCAAFGKAVERPEGYDRLAVAFEQITTDSTLDNGLIKATFEENGALCRYSAILLADNAASTIKLVESKAYAPTRDATCEEGRQVLDRAFAANDYLYYGHPHNLAIMAPVAGADGVCGAGAELVGVNFVVKGKVQ